MISLMANTESIFSILKYPFLKIYEMLFHWRPDQMGIQD